MNTETHKQFKRDLNQAFRELRKLGYFARQNFTCCNSCGWASIPNGIDEKAVFYHRQDTATIRDYGICYLSWSGNGNEIARVFSKYFKIEWDGSEDRKIVAKLKEDK